MRPLASVLKWTRMRSHESFFELEANRNAGFELVVAARSSLHAAPDPSRDVTGDEIIAWAWGLTCDDPAFETAWNALDWFSVGQPS